MSKIIKPAEVAFSMETAGQGAAQAAVQGAAQSAAQVASSAIDQSAAGANQGIGFAAAGFEQTQEKVKAQMDKAIRTAEEMVSFGQGNLEAMVKSGQIFAAGMQDLSQQMAAHAQAALNDTFSTFKALTGVRSFKEAVELQTGLARATVEKTLSETGRLTEASLKLAEQSFAPIAARVTLTVEKFAKA
jgi:phasin family protein